MKYLVALLSLSLLFSCASKTENSNNNPQNMQSQNQTKNTLVYVDVREDSEWDAGHIKGAIHVPLGEIQAGNFEKIPKNTNVALYCRSGRRADIALEILKKAGYKNIQNLGGMRDIKNVEIVR